MVSAEKKVWNFTLHTSFFSLPYARDEILKYILALPYFVLERIFFQFVLIRLLPADILTISIMMININKTMIRHKCDLLITVRLNYLISVYGLQKISFYAHACVACVSIGHQKAES